MRALLLAKDIAPRPPAAALHLAHEEDPQADQDEQREPVDQDLTRFFTRSFKLLILSLD
jgi:hypothetical protein